MRRLVSVCVLGLALVLTPATARADHDGGGYDGGEYDDRRGDCRGVDKGGHCEDNDFSPKFDKSPVQDSFIFNPTICLPGSTCHVDGRQPPEEGSTE